MDLLSSCNQDSFECPVCSKSFVKSDYVDALAGNPDPSTHIDEGSDSVSPSRSVKARPASPTDGPLQDDPRGRPERPESAGSSLTREGSDGVSLSLLAKACPYCQIPSGSSSHLPQGREEPPPSYASATAVIRPDCFTDAPPPYAELSPQNGGHFQTPEDSLSQSSLRELSVKSFKCPFCTEILNVNLQKFEIHVQESHQARLDACQDIPVYIYGLFMAVEPLPNQPKGLANHPTQPSVGRRAPAQVEEDIPRMIKQPETRPISQEQLVAEVKGIYAGLVMVETKCIGVNNSIQNSQQGPNNNRLNHEQWQALIALHRTLLHEHQDFFLASQHPSASAPLRRLAWKYAMPARMWRHGIHSFLELLRARLPSSREHMLTFICLAYAMMALLYETVPAFEDTWIECLGDLGRYRMAIEEEDMKDRNVWTITSRYWYSKASDKAPTTGRLYHHLAILARPNALLQLFYYNKSLCVAIPFLSARDSILTLFDPIMALPATHQSRLPATELAFVRCHSIMFSGKSPERLEPSMDQFIRSLDNYIACSGLKFLEAGYTISISNSCIVMGSGNKANSVFAEICEINAQTPPRDIDESEVREKTNPTLPTPEEIDRQREVTAHAVKLSNLTHNVVLRRFGDLNTLPYIHATLAFIYHMMFCTESMERYIGPGFPWQLLAENLNTLLNAPSLTPAMLDRIEGDAFPEVVRDLSGGNKGPDAEMATTDVPKRKPLPEDFAMRGLLWTEKYLPDGYFQQERIDDEEKYFEVPSMAEQRRERVLFLGCRIAEVGNQRFLQYSNQLFSAGREFNGELGNPPKSIMSFFLGCISELVDSYNCLCR